MFKPIVIKSKYFSWMNIAQSDEEDVNSAVDDVARTSHVLE